MILKKSLLLTALIQVGAISVMQESALASSEAPWAKLKCSGDVLTLRDGLYKQLENDVSEVLVTVNDDPALYPHTVSGSVEVKFSLTSHARFYLDNLSGNVIFNDIPFYLDKDETYDSRAGYASMWELLKLGTENLSTDSQVYTLKGSTGQPIGSIGLISREVEVKSLFHSRDAKANDIFVRLNTFEGNDAIRHISFDITKCKVETRN